MRKLAIRAGKYLFEAQLELALAPDTCAAFMERMPFTSQLVHVRWSGEAVWVPLGDEKFGVGYENATSYPAPGQIILYPGGISETEILLAYGGVHFASKMGQLAGNHFITLTSGLENLPLLGKDTLWHGAQSFSIEKGWVQPFTRMVSAQGENSDVKTEDTGSKPCALKAAEKYVQ